jgi:drug/metabolite transporter (DMT)-like permease
MAGRRVARIRPVTIALIVVGIALLVVGIVFFVEPGHHIRRGLLAIVLAIGCGVAAFLLEKKFRT